MDLGIYKLIGEDIVFPEYGVTKNIDGQGNVSFQEKGSSP